MGGIPTPDSGLALADGVEGGDGRDDGSAGVSGKRLDQWSPEPAGTSSIA